MLAHVGALQTAVRRVILCETPALSRGLYPSIDHMLVLSLGSWKVGAHRDICWSWFLPGHDGWALYLVVSFVEHLTLRCSGSLLSRRKLLRAR